MKTPRCRRNPDGTPAVRSIDDLLATAVTPDAIRHLPGKGQPLDLDGYFRADPEQRMAGRLLRDNDVLPQPLQDRRDAEVARHRAEDALAWASEELTRRRHRIEQWGACVAATTVADPILPDDLRPGLVSLLRPVDAASVAEQLQQELDAYRRQRRQARQHVRQLAEAADALAGTLNEQIVLSRHLPALLQVSRMDTAGVLARFDAVAPDLPPLPDLNRRHGARPSWWRRLFVEGTVRRS